MLATILSLLIASLMLNAELPEREYHERVAQTIAILKHDLPTLFQQDITYHIYSQDITFRDPVNWFDTWDRSSRAILQQFLPQH